MDIIDLLDKNTIYILDRNELLLPLIKKELTATLISSNKLNDQEITNIKNDFIRSNNFESETTSGSAKRCSTSSNSEIKAFT